MSAMVFNDWVHGGKGEIKARSMGHRKSRTERIRYKGCSLDNGDCLRNAYQIFGIGENEGG